MRKLYTFFLALFAICGLAQAQVTFDFSGATAYEQFGLTGFSSSDSKDGDITAENGASTTSGDVTITVSPSTTANANRMWSGSLRMYSGTMTIASAGDNITAIKFTLNKWGSNNSFDSGTYASNTWTGDAATVVLTVSANTQIKSIEVTLGEDSGEGGGDPDPTPTIDWTSSAEAPLTVASTLEKAANLATGTSTEANVYVKGIISSIKYTFDADHGTATFSISDDGQAANEFLCYGTYYLGNRAWVENDTQIEVGNEVIICGIVTNYNGTLEMASKKNYIYSLNGVTDGGEVTVPEYTTIEAIQTAAQTLGETKVDVKYTISNTVVTYVNGQYVYVTDGSRALLLYGTNSKNLKAGDVLSGYITGKLQLFRGLTELGSANYENVTVTEGEAPAPEVVTEVGPIAADATRLQYESKLVTVEGVTITVKENEAYYLVDDSDNELLLYFKNANDFKDLLLDLDATYNVTGIVGNHNGVQLAPRDANDFVKASETNLQTPESGWDVETVVVAFGEAVTANFTTNSDATVKYGSDNPEVATISQDGVITIVGPGQAIIYAETEATATFKSDYKEFTLIVTSGADGTLEKPFAIADMLAFVTESKVNLYEDVWVKGYIVGYINGSALNVNTAMFSADAPEGTDKEGKPLTVTASNILIAASADVNDVEQVVPVALKNNTDARNDLNLAANPSRLGTEVWLKGNVTKYMGVTGLKEVAVYSLNGTDVVDAVRNINAEATANGAIYTIAGQRVGSMTKAGIYVVGGHKVVVK